MAFRMTGLSAGPFQHLFGVPDDALSSHGVKRTVVDGKPGFPDRVEMRDAEPGETMLLRNHVCQAADTPYCATHAIFVREGASVTYDAVDEVPEMMRIGLPSLCPFDDQGMVLDAEEAAGVKITRWKDGYQVLSPCYLVRMANLLTKARKRQPARLNGAKRPSPRAAMALAKSQEYQDAADAPSTLRAYAGDLANFNAWWEKHRFPPMPATPEVVGAYLAAAGEGYAVPTLRRRVAAIARACGVAGQPLDTKHPAVGDPPRHRPQTWLASATRGRPDHYRNQEAKPSLR